MSSYDPRRFRWVTTPGVEHHPRIGLGPEGRWGTVVVRIGDKVKVTEFIPKDQQEGDGPWERVVKDHQNAITMRIDGPNADDYRWIQFVWIEVIVDERGGVTRRTPTPSGFGPTGVSSTGGDMELTTDPQDPNINVDSASEDSPCYDDKGLGERNGGRNQIWDEPDVGKALSLADGIDRAVLVTAVFHYSTYLIKDGVIVYYIRWTVTGQWDPQGPIGDPNLVPAVYQILEQGPGGTLAPGEGPALDAEYPDQSTLK